MDSVGKPPKKKLRRSKAHGEIISAWHDVHDRIIFHIA